MRFIIFLGFLFPLALQCWGFFGLIHTLLSEVLPSSLSSRFLRFASPLLFLPLHFLLHPSCWALLPSLRLSFYVVVFHFPPLTQPYSAVLPLQTPMLSSGPQHRLRNQRLLTAGLPGFASAAQHTIRHLAGWSLIGRHFSFWRSAIDACGCSFGCKRAKENSLHQESLDHPSCR